MEQICLLQLLLKASPGKSNAAQAGCCLKRLSSLQEGSPELPIPPALGASPQPSKAELCYTDPPAVQSPYLARENVYLDEQGSQLQVLAVVVFQGYRSETYRDSSGVTRRVSPLAQNSSGFSLCPSTLPWQSLPSNGSKWM